MRHSIRAFCELAAGLLPCGGPVYEFGAAQVQPAALSDMRPFFPGLEYVGCDQQAGRGVDRLENLHSLSLPTGCAGTVVCLDTLEHVEEPRLALAEIRRILRPGGVLILSSVFAFEIHHPPDYWRFSPEGFRSLLRHFPEPIVDWAGQPAMPHTVVGLALKGETIGDEPGRSIRRALEGWRHRFRRG